MCSDTSQEKLYRRTNVKVPEGSPGRASCGDNELAVIHELGGAPTTRELRPERSDTVALAERDGNYRTTRHESRKGIKVPRRSKGGEESPIARNLDALLRAYRDQNGKRFTVEEIAKEINRPGLSASYIYALRSGEKRNPTVDALQELARFFGVRVGYFFDGDKDALPAPPSPAPTSPTPVSAPAPTNDDGDGGSSGDGSEDGHDSRLPPTGEARAGLAARLDNLLTMQRRPDGSAWSLRQVSQAAQERGVSLSVGYLNDLRRGLKSDPKVSQLEALADIFGVHIDYFYASVSTIRELDSKLEALGALQDRRVATIALRAKNLSPRDLMMLNALIDSALHGEDRGESRDDPERDIT